MYQEMDFTNLEQNLDGQKGRRTKHRWTKGR